MQLLFAFFSSHIIKLKDPSTLVTGCVGIMKLLNAILPLNNTFQVLGIHDKRLKACGK